MRLVLATIVTFLLLAEACSLHVTHNELVGTYRAQNEAGYALLALRPDGTYAQMIHRNETGKEETASGRWNYSPRFESVVLQNDYSIAQNMLGPKVNGESLPAEKWFGRIELCCDPNNNCYYKKQSDQPDPGLFVKASQPTGKFPRGWRRY